MRPDRFGAALVAALASLAAPPPAADAAVATVPFEHQDVEGGGASSLPFFEPEGRYQQVFDASELARLGGPIRISQIVFRPNSGQSAFSQAADLTVQLSTTGVDPGSLAPDFASNLGPDSVRVWSGLLTLESSSLGATPTSARDMSVRIRLEEPFLYDPATGHLLLDVTVHGSGGGFQLDAATSSPSTGFAWAAESDAATADVVTGGSGLVTAFVGTLLASGPAVLVDDIRLRRSVNRSNVESLVTDGGRAFFVATSEGVGEELWTSDGSDAGTRLVKDIRPGIASCTCTDLVNVAGTIFFRADDGAHGPELWKTDGTAAGTEPVTDVPDALAGYPFSLTAVADTLFFVRSHVPYGTELWKSDGTEAGTELVADLVPGAGSSTPTSLTAVAGRLFFVTSAGLWVSDGTASGTVLVKATGADLSSPRNLVAAAGLLFFVADGTETGTELWVSDGTWEGTRLVADVRPGPDGSAPAQLSPADGWLYFVADDGASGAELWRSDGTPAGTTRSVDLEPGDGSAGIVILAALGNEIVFSGGSGYALWLSDGVDTPRFLGPVNVRNPTPSARAFGKLFFGGWASSTGGELWTTDGTPEGTSLVREINPGSSGPSSILALAAVGERLLVHVQDREPDDELWTSDGTWHGTRPLEELHADTGASAPDLLATWNGALFLRADDGRSKNQIWRLDEMQRGAKSVKRFTPSGVTFPAALASLGDVFLFAAWDENGSELWRSDGTEAGTALVKDIRPGSGSSLPLSHGTARLGELLIFQADDGSHGVEPWRSDGTAAGTQLVKDSKPGFAGSDPRGFVELAGHVYFGASAGLWSTDGTEAGTVLVRDVAAGSPTRSGEVLFFWRTGAELWKTDGTASGTVLVRDLDPDPSASVLREMTDFGGTLLFVADDGVSGEELWASDGTYAGTFQVLDVRPGPLPSTPRGLVVVGDRAFFAADDGSSGRELWVTDGSTDGTWGLDIASGPQSSFPVETFALEAGVLFQACTEALGCELWASDGTQAGTHLVADVAPGPSSSNPADFVRRGPWVYLRASDGSSGSELWAVRAGACGDGELDVLEQCDDGNPYDGDGCSAGCRITVECSDGVDNDWDGATDWDGAGTGAADRDCRSAEWHREAPVLGCGLGPELALLLPLLRRARRLGHALAASRIRDARGARSRRPRW